MMTSTIRWCSFSAALSLAAWLTCSTAYAGSIGVSFTVDTATDLYELTAGESAGVVAASNWNNLFSASGSGVSLNSDAGASSVTLDYNGASDGSKNAVIPSTATPHQKMMGYGMETGAISGPVRDNQYRFNSLGSLFTGPYDVYVYFGDRQPDYMSGQGQAYVSSAASDYTTPGQINDPVLPTGNEIAAPQSWDIPDNTSFVYPAPGYVENMNYVKFTGLTADTLVVSTHITGNNGTYNGGLQDWPFSTVNGIQIVGPTAAVPEPSSFVLAGLGLLGLATWGLRRSTA